ncbi:phenylacetate--CoA ligase family protein [Candidatus Magnetominusculus dajiuhuensis]|uniref:phenylacetate--CoA ligase family protein n=1 Tax=Candidatus Magnetominusculus dajiuhuensis TaxID=3137712 RepID=UPI003B439D1A
MRFFDSIDFSSPADIKNVQDRLLAELIGYVSIKSQYYKDIFRQNNIAPNEIKGVDELPFTTREDLQRHNWDFLAVQRVSLREIVSTTGTTGQPQFIAMTEGDIDRLAYNEQRSFTYTGAKEGDLFHIAVTGDNLFIAGAAYYRGLIRLGAAVARVGPQNTIRQFDLIEKLRPSAIVAVPSFMLHMARAANELKIDPKDLNIKKAVLIGESIRDTSLRSNALGELVEEAFGDICYSTYGITEGQVSFCECGQKEGLHSHPDLVIAEVVDEAGVPRNDGETGELVLTTLQIEGMPLIRYKTGDITFKITEPCKCGRNSLRIGPIIGRKMQRLKIKGVTLYPKTIENAICKLKDVVNYQIEAATGENQSDRIILRVGSFRADKAFRDGIIENLRAKARVTPELQIESPEDINKRLYEGGARKAVVFKDVRKATK